MLLHEVFYNGDQRYEPFIRVDSKSQICILKECRLNGKYFEGEGRMSAVIVDHKKESTPCLQLLIVSEKERTSHEPINSDV
jgi:hypothetical protein